MEGGLLQSLGASFEHSVQRLQRSEHSGDVAFAEVEPGSLFQTFVPQFVPENGHSNELLADHHGLLDQHGTVFAHVFQDFVGGVVPGLQRRFGGHRQRVDQSLAEMISHQSYINSTSYCDGEEYIYSNLAKFMKIFLLPTEMVLKTEN